MESVDRLERYVLGRVQGQRGRSGKRAGQGTQARREARRVEPGRSLGGGGPRQYVVEGPQRFVRGEGGPDPRRQRAQGRVGHEGNRARERLVEHQGQRVHVGPAVDRLAFGRLRRDVAGGPHHGPRGLGVGRLGQRPGDAEVGHPYPSLLVEEKVRRLDIPVHQPPGMGVGQALCDLGAQMGGLGVAETDPAVEQVAQRSAPQVLQHQVGTVGVLAPVEDPQHMGVVQRRHRAGLGAEALEERLVAGQPGLKDLDGDMALQGHVFGQEDVR